MIIPVFISPCIMLMLWVHVCMHARLQHGYACALHTSWMENLSCSLGSVIMPSQMLTGTLRNISTSASKVTALLQLAPHKGIWTDCTRLDI